MAGSFLGALGGGAIGSAVVTLTLDTKAYNAQLAGAQAQTSAATKAMGGATNTFSKSSTTALLGVAGAVGLIGIAVTKAAVDYETAFTKIEALSNAAAEDVAIWKEEVLGLAGATGQAPAELAEALFFLSSAGLETTEVMDALEASAKGSAIGLGTTAEVANIVASALNAYAGSGLTAIQVTDTLVQAIKSGRASPDEFATALGRILPIASKAGVEFDEVAASLAGLSNIGLDVNEGVTAMRGLIGAIVAPTQKAKDEMDRLGLTADDLRAVLSEGGLLAALQLMEERTDGNLDSLTALVPNIRALTGQLGLTGANAETVARIFDEVANATNATNDAFAIMSEDVGFQMERLAANAQVAAITIGDKLLPVLNLVVENFEALVYAVGVFLGLKLVPTLEAIALRLAVIGNVSLTTQGQITKMAGALGKIGVGGVAGIAAAIYGITQLIDGLSVSLEEVSEKTGLTVGSLEQLGRTFGKDVGLGDKLTFGGFVSLLDGVNDNIRDELGPALGEAKNAFIEMGLGAEEAEGYVVSFAERGLQDLGSGSLQGFGEHMAETINQVAEMGQALGEGEYDVKEYAGFIEQMGFTHEEAMGLADVALDKYGQKLDETGHAVRQFAGMTDEELKEWSSAMSESFNDAFLNLGEFEDQFTGTTAGLVKNLQKAETQARQHVQDMRTVMKLDVAEDQTIVAQLIGDPGLLHKFVTGTKGQQDAIVGAIEGINKAGGDRNEILERTVRLTDDIPEKKHMDVEVQFTYPGYRDDVRIPGVGGP